ncbi:hypothetical protein ZWY2020_037117 [Hordeum vulgare]|nr:hypothetical protein ZWY2020_037117 [Hordeum vulgare]
MSSSFHTVVSFPLHPASSSSNDSCCGLSPWPPVVPWMVLVEFARCFRWLLPGSVGHSVVAFQVGRLFLRVCLLAAVLVPLRHFGWK